MKSVVAGSIALAVFASINICPLQAQTLSPKRKSPGEIAAASKLLAEKNESCNQQARAQNLHLFKRRRFMRECRSKP
jgi:hypothetical protein